MTLFSLIFIPLVGGGLAWYSERLDPTWPRKVALASLLLSWLPLFAFFSFFQIDTLPLWLAEVNYPWIPRLGIHAHLAMDGMSFLLVVLTLLMGLVALSSAWYEIKQRVGFFYFNLLWTLAGILGIFLAMDLFLFFVFWEIMLVPMYFLIAIWGYEQRQYAAYKFFLFTQAGGLLLLLSIAALVLLHYQQTGTLTFNYKLLLQSPIQSEFSYWIALGFSLAFIVKLPAFPFHSWLPDAHTQAPTPASIILAAVLLKTGGYGLIRFVLPLFPQASVELAPLMLTLAGIGVIYGAMLAFVQTDLKRLVAYSSVSHMGFVLLGCFAFNMYALQGAMMQMLAHGISTSALFMLVGMIQHRFHTRDLNQLGGIWQLLPKLSAIGLFFAVASLGMPGLGNFVADFLVLLGGFQKYPYFTLIATFGLILAAIYSLLIIYRTFFGPIISAPTPSVQDLNTREATTLFAMSVLLIIMGLHPQPLLDMVQAQFAQTIGSWS